MKRRVIADNPAKSNRRATENSSISSFFRPEPWAARALLFRGRGIFPCGGAGLFPLCGFFQPELLNPIANLISVQTKQGGGPGVVPAGALERLHHELAFDRLQADALFRQLEQLPAR